MGILSGIIGAGMSAIGSIGGAIAGGVSARKQRDMINAQKQQNEDWYNRRYNEDATQRGDAQRLLTMTEESIKNRNRQAAGAAAVGGATEESVAAAKAANNQVMADTISNINAQADARKDAIEQTYQTRDASLNQQLIETEKAKQQAIAGAVKGISDAGGAIANSGFGNFADLKNAFK